MRYDYLEIVSISYVGKLPMEYLSLAMEHILLYGIYLWNTSIEDDGDISM